MKKYFPHCARIKTRPHFLASFFVVFALLLTACSDSPTAVVLSGKTMGTSYNITLANPDKTLDLTHLQDVINQELLKINQLMSTYIPDSELSRFNHQVKVGEWYPLSAETYAVLDYSLQLSEQTKGAFDVTVAPLINLWGFGYQKKTTFPSDEEILDALTSIGYQYIELDQATRSVKKLRPVTVDLSAVAKGYGVDHIAQVLDSKNVQHYLVEIGGEIRVKGQNKEGNAWRIGIETPALHQSGAQKIIALNNLAVATSGDYRNFFEKDGVRYSHTIDPLTGKPVIHNIASLTVLHEQTMEADALATAFMAMGKERAIAMANVYNIPVYILLYENNSFTASYSKAFEQHLSSK